MSGKKENKTYLGARMTDIGKKLYLNTKTADVHFSFGLDDDMVKLVAAHKNILAAGSDVFDAMFYGDLREKGDVKVVDASEAAFMEFLQFFYLNRVQLTIENITDVMNLGNKYNVPNCVKACVAFLRDVLSVDNIFIALNLATIYDQQELMKLCKKFVILNTAEIFQTIGFLECDRLAVAHILQLDLLSCSEVEVFKACMSWVRAKSKQSVLSKALVQEHLGDLYYEIRFKSMTVQELCSLQTEYESVLISDFVKITNMIANPGFQADNFNNQPRHAKWDADAIVECDRRSKNDSESAYYTDNERSTIFSTDGPLLLGSFVCSKIQFFDSSYRDLTSDLLVDVEIFEARNLDDTNTDGGALLKMKATLQSSNDNHIQLTHPVLIRPGFFYKIRIGPFPDKHIYFSKNLLDIFHPVASDFVQFHNCYTRDDKINAMISSLSFNKLFEDE